MGQVFSVPQHIQHFIQLIHRQTFWFRPAFREARIKEKEKVHTHKLSAKDWEHVLDAQTVCRDASEKVLAFLVSLFSPGEAVPVLEDDGILDMPEQLVMEQKRAKNAVLRRQIHVKELELEVLSLSFETLRLSIKEKEKDMRETRKLQQEALDDSNEFLAASSSVILPILPLDIVEIILAFLCWDSDAGRLRKGFASGITGMERSIRRDSCVSRLLECPAIGDTWKSIILRHFPPELALFCTVNKQEEEGEETEEANPEAPYVWKVFSALDYIEGYISKPSRAKKLLLDISRHCGMPADSEEMFISEFYTYQTFQWERIMMNSNDRTALHSIAKFHSESLRTVRSLLMFDWHNPLDEGQDEGDGQHLETLDLASLAVVFTALESASIPCHALRAWSPLFVHLKELYLTIHLDVVDAEGLVANLRCIPPSVLHLAISNSTKPNARGPDDYNFRQLDSESEGKIERFRKLPSQGFKLNAPLLDRLEIGGFDRLSTEILLSVLGGSEVRHLKLFVDGTWRGSSYHVRSYEGFGKLMSAIDRYLPNLKRLSCKTITSNGYDGETSSPAVIAFVLRFLMPQVTEKKDYMPKCPEGYIPESQEEYEGQSWDEYTTVGDASRWRLPNLESLDMHHDSFLNEHELLHILRAVRGRRESDEVVNIRSVVLRGPFLRANDEFQSSAIMLRINALNVALDHFAICHEENQA